MTMTPEQLFDAAVQLHSDIEAFEADNELDPDGPAQEILSEAINALHALSELLVRWENEG
jgi:hypothetical protein